MTWRIWDTNGDGVKTSIEIFSLVRIAIYLFSGLWAVIHVEKFSDMQFIAVVAASFGSSVFEMFLKSKSDEGKEKVSEFPDVRRGDNTDVMDERV